MSDYGDGKGSGKDVGKPDNDNDYEVGHSRPPKDSRFKPGKSGNPNGRPKGSRNMKTDLEDLLKARMHVTKDGRSVTMSTQKVILARLAEKSLKGDIRFMSKLFDLIGIHLKDEETEVKDRPVSQSDTEILKAFKRSLQPDDDEDTDGEENGKNTSQENGEDDE